MSEKSSVAGATNARLLARSCESLLGIAAGVVADGVLNDKEVQFLSTWLLEHPELASSWPGEVVYKRVREVLADGVISSEEREYLRLTLEQLIGGSFADDGAVASGSTGLPIDGDVVVAIPNESFCFTGKFLYGTRSLCERAVTSRGGRLENVQRSLCFLVVGDLSSRDWKYSSHGTKIMAAVKLRDDGRPIRIISEAQWVAAL